MVMGVLWQFCFLKREKRKSDKKNKQKPNQPNFYGFETSGSFLGFFLLWGI